ncbi:hypothetical protein [Bombella mellum]|uniref:hypothetical protein n=1 Tax=Bombella mellum TaxID=2039288 RepID=UPI0015F5A6BD|nr:hypothetical protein [Bombella mellum]
MSQFSSFSFPYRCRLLSVLLLGAFCLASPAWAGGAARTDDDDPAVNAKGVVVNNILAVLRVSPNSAGRQCLKTLDEMHKVQKQLDDEETAQRSFDVGLLRDVLESDMESVIASCGRDARTSCEGGAAGQNARLGRICSQLFELDSEDQGDDLQ